MPCLYVFPYMVHVIKIRILRWEIIPDYPWALNAAKGVLRGSRGALTHTGAQPREDGADRGGKMLALKAGVTRPQAKDAGSHQELEEFSQRTSQGGSPVHTFSPVKMIWGFLASRTVRE